MTDLNYRLLSIVFTAVLSVTQACVAAVPAAPVMSLYRFNGDLDTPYYTVESFEKSGTKKAAGYLAQGSRVIPCVVVRNGKALTDKNGTPYVGFEVVMDAKKANASSAGKLLNKVAEREGKMVANHHCGSGNRFVINAKRLINRQKPPFFDPAGKGKKNPGGINTIDNIVRAFHNSSQCKTANKKLTGRRAALSNAWSGFIAKNQGKWTKSELNKAKHLDYAMRTAIYEGHIGRGCSAYGACERNIILLSIRNRAYGQCLSRQGCNYEGDIQGASSSVSQYNIWDEYLTQTSGLTACFLRTDLADQEPYSKLQAMYSQTVPDASKILFGASGDLDEIFQGVSDNNIRSLRHYYHPPAMGACYPQHDRVEYISAAVAKKGNDHILIANKRIKVDGKSNGDYKFRDFIVSLGEGVDRVNISDTYKGFSIDGRKVSLKKSTRCTPYGVSKGCKFNNIGRYRKTPFWLNSGKTAAFTCNILASGDSCSAPQSQQSVTVGGACDIEMMPVSGVK